MTAQQEFAIVRLKLQNEIHTAIGDGDEGTRSRMPNFQMTGDIREKISRIRTLLREGKIQDAVTSTEDLIEHLRGKQSAFARGAVRRFWAIITERMVDDRLDDDLIAQVRTKVEAFETFVSSRFDLDEAGKLFWAAEETIDRVYAEQNGRDRKAARKAAREATEKIVRQKAEERERALIQAQRPRQRTAVSVDREVKQIEIGQIEAIAFDEMLGKIL